MPTTTVIKSKVIVFNIPKNDPKEYNKALDSVKEYLESDKGGTYTEPPTNITYMDNIGKLMITYKVTETIQTE